MGDSSNAWFFLHPSTCFLCCLVLFRLHPQLTWKKTLTFQRGSGILKVEKALQDNWVQPLTEHPMSIKPYHEVSSFSVFWTLPWVVTPLLSWATCSNVWPFLQWRIFSSYPTWTSPAITLGHFALSYWYFPRKRGQPHLPMINSYKLQ